MAAAAPKKKPKPLTPKMQLFVDEFLIDKKGAAAAERAGYPAKSAKQIAYKLLQDERVCAAIDKVLEVHAMRAAEAVSLLADWGRGTVKRFLKVQEDGKMVINLAHPEAQENLHLLKKVKQKRRIITTEHAQIEEITTEIDLHDAKDAVHKILQLHGRYAPQKHDHTTNGKDLPVGPPPNIYMPDNGR